MAGRKRKRRGGRRKSSAGRFGAMLFGLVAGVVIASVAWWQLSPSPRGVDSVPDSTAGTPAARPDTERAPAPARPVEIEPSGAGYDFYEMLPEQEVVVSDDFRERRARGTRDGTPPPAVTEPGSYMMQAGSFRVADGAERTKALLALQNIRADIVPVPSGSGTLHQVRVGPVDVATLNTYRKRLAAADIDVIVWRVAD